MRYVWLLLSFMIINTIHGQDFIYDNYVYATNIKSVKFHPEHLPLEMPVTYINSGILQLSFDDLQADVKDLTYEIIHCTYDWKPSQLGQLEYLEGFLNGEIRGSEFSRSTFIPYTHYELTLPNRDYNWTRSGNYLLIIYEGDDEDRLPIITRRFMVVDPKVAIKWDERGAVGSANQYANHVFDLRVTTNDYRITNPLQSIKTVVLQNNRWFDAKVFRPSFVVGSDIVIDNTGKISFPAVKEFRDFDIRSLDFANERIKSIDLNENGTVAYVDTDRPRTGRAYLKNKDANGQFIIQNKDGADSATSADYAYVDFTLKTDPYLEDVYIAGDFTDWKADEMYKMTYNYDKGAYEAEILLKQGYYNYLYGLLTKDGLDFEEIEGNNTNTENNYQVFVYLREPGTRYDELISFTTFSSKDF